MSRVPIRETLPSGSDQVSPCRDLEALGRASLISRSSKAKAINNRGSNMAIRANSVFSRARRANGGVVMASRAVINRD